MPGWRIAARAWASLRMAAGFEPGRPALIATRRLSARSCASNTWPRAPSPRSDRTSYVSLKTSPGAKMGDAGGAESDDDDEPKPSRLPRERARLATNACPFSLRWHALQQEEAPA